MPGTVEGGAGAAVVDDDLGAVGVIDIQQVGGAEVGRQGQAAGVGTAGGNVGGCGCAGGAAVFTQLGTQQVSCSDIDLGAVIKPRVAVCLGINGVAQGDFAAAS